MYNACGATYLFFIGPVGLVGEFILQGEPGGVEVDGVSPGHPHRGTAFSLCQQVLHPSRSHCSIRDHSQRPQSETTVRDHQSQANIIMTRNMTTIMIITNYKKIVLLFLFFYIFFYNLFN